MMAAAVTFAAMSLGELLGPAAGAHAGLEVTDIVLDNRQVQPGAAFVALAGGTTHGLEFAADALARGAAIVVYDPAGTSLSAPSPSVAVPGLRDRLGELGVRFFGRSSRTEDLVGVTGTNGKTTVAFLIAQALGQLGRPCAYIGTLGAGLPDSLAPQALTTPDCLTLHREIARLGTPVVALEVSSHAIVQERIAGLRVQTAAFTNLSRDHLDAHGSFEAYGEAKARLFRRAGLERAVINIDDAFGAALLPQLPDGVRGIGVSLADRPDAELKAELTSRGLAGLRLALRAPDGAATIESRLIGRFNGENLMLAAGALLALGTELDAACSALSVCRAAPGRMDVQGGGPAPWVVVDYAHTPAALERVLDELTRAATGRLVCVFGCGGDRDRGKRALMGAAAAARADGIVLTDDNPRSEDPAQIIADIAAGTAGHPNLRVEHDREQAILSAIAAADRGDVVLIAGKGHEATQRIGERLRPLDDRAIVRRALEART
jgi:UDP-N-acetylmuramoyl-L-alanyl-D-glutamate--2,6-diaminopimelate ligase